MRSTRAVEQRDNPDCAASDSRGRRGKRGVVTTASYEARAFGCRSAMADGAGLASARTDRRADADERVRAESAIRAILERFSRTSSRSASMRRS